MSYYQIFPRDESYEDWLFFVDDDRGANHLKACISPRACRQCGKFDEEESIRACAVNLDFQSRNKANAFGTLDDWLILKKEPARQLAEQAIESVPVNADKTLFAVLPPRLELDPTKSGFEYRGGHCQTCGRACEATIGPLSDSFLVPDSPPLIWSTVEHSESIRGARLGLWCLGSKRRLLAALLGKRVEFCEAL